MLAYKGIMRLLLNIIYGILRHRYWQVICCTILWGDTNGSCRLQKDLITAITVSNTACYITMLLI